MSDWLEGGIYDFGRFFAKVCQDGTPGGCWLWSGYTNADGYGVFSVNREPLPAHCWAYEQQHGPVPGGLEIDHLCRVPSCVKPSHLEAVTHAENVRRGAAARPQKECARGHTYAAGTYRTYRKKDGRPLRVCCECQRIRNANRRTNPKKCTASGCNAPQLAKGVCQMHYDRARYGRKSIG